MGKYLTNLKSRYESGEDVNFAIDTFYSDSNTAYANNAVRNSSYYSKEEMSILLEGGEIEIFPDEWESINTDEDDE